MATKLYPTSNRRGAFTTPTPKGAWDRTTDNVKTKLTTMRMGRGEDIRGTDNNATANWDVLCLTSVSDPLKTGVTISGTVDIRLCVTESATAADMVLHAHVWVTQGDTDVVRGTLLSDHIDVTEFAQSASATAASAITISGVSLSSVAAQAGDRIVTELGFRAGNAVSTSYTGVIIAGGNQTSDSDGTESAQSPVGCGHGYLNFSTTMDFGTYTYLWTSGDAAPFTPGAVNGTWDVDSKVDRYLQRQGDATTGNNAATEIVTTNPWDILLVRWVSDKLAAQTINAVQMVSIIRALENSSAANAFIKYHLYVVKPDGTSRGVLLSNNIDATEIGSSTSTTSSIVATLSSLAVLDEDRLVFEIGVRFTNTVTTSYTATVYFGGDGGLQGGELGGPYGGNISSNGSGYLEIDQELLWYTPSANLGRSQAVVVGG